MKSFTFFMYDVDGENIRNASSQFQQPNREAEKAKTQVAAEPKKLNLWQRIKAELQGWSNKDANDSAYDDTQV